MQRGNLTELNRIMRRVEEQRKVRFTRTASEMLYGMVDAVTRDPHPSWRNQVSEGSLDAFQKDMISSLEVRLMEMPLPGADGSISTFDLLHSVSSIIDAICPFKKIRG